MDYSKLTKEELIKLLNNNEPKVDEELARIIEDEKMRAKAKKILFIEEDFDPESTNTWSCSINGKQYLVPKGVETEVPLAVYEAYKAEEERKRTAIARLRAAAKKVTG